MTLETNPEIGDVELVRRAQAHRPGDPAGAEAVCKIFDRYHPAIFRYLWARLGDRQTAEDLAGEVFARMIAGLPKYRPGETPFAAWLYRIARNLLIDHYRKNGRRPETPLERAEALSFKADDPIGDPAQEIEGRMFIEKIRKLLERFPPSEQEVLILRFITGLPIKDVACILGKSVGAVKIAQHRGLSELRKLLEADRAKEIENDRA